MNIRIVTRMRVATVLLPALLLVACRQDGALTMEERDAIEMEVGARVTEIYDEVCSWYSAYLADVGKNDFDARFLTTGFRQLYDEAASVGQEKNEVPAGQDYDHWIQAQDWGGFVAVIDSINVLARDTAAVFIALSNHRGAYTPFALMMVKEKPGCHASDGAWLIDDFVGCDAAGHFYATSDRALMEEYIRENGPSDKNDVLKRQVKARVLEIYGEMIAACQAAKAKGKVQSLYDFNTDRFLTRDYFRWYERVDSIDHGKDVGEKFFFDTEHWGLNLDQDGIREAKVQRVSISNKPSRIPALQADVVLRLTCETYYLSRDTLVTHSDVHLRMAFERGNWYVDDYLNGYSPYSEKDKMKAYVHHEWLQGVWDYEPNDGDVASHYIIRGDTLIYPKRCDPVEFATYTFQLAGDTLYLRDAKSNDEWKMFFSFSDGKLWTTEVWPDLKSKGKSDAQEFVSVKRDER